MASGITEHYGLCQWQPGDNFIREEFNGDNRRVDTALYQAKILADQAVRDLIPVSYNVYNLALRDYYEGKNTAFKRALVFDGFLDGNGVESLTPGLILDTRAHTLTLNARGLLSETTGVLGDGTIQGIHDMDGTVDVKIVAQATGRLNGMTLYFTGEMTMELRDGGKNLLWSGDLTGGGLAGAYYAVSAELVAGASYAILLKKIGTNTLRFYYGDGSPVWFVYTMHGTPRPITQGLMTGRQVSVGNGGHTRALAWVRHTGESVVPRLYSAGGWRDMVAEGARETLTLDGTPCRETRYSLEGVTETELRVALQFNAQPDHNIQVFDYGIILL